MVNHGNCKIRLEELQLDASVLPLELMQRIATYVREATGKEVEYVSVIYKLQDLNPCSVTLRTHNYDRELGARERRRKRCRKTREMTPSRMGSRATSAE